MSNNYVNRFRQRAAKSTGMTPEALKRLERMKERPPGEPGSGGYAIAGGKVTLFRGATQEQIRKDKARRLKAIQAQTDAPRNLKGGASVAQRVSPGVKARGVRRGRPTTPVDERPVGGRQEGAAGEPDPRAQEWLSAAEKNADNPEVAEVYLRPFENMTPEQMQEAGVDPARVAATRTLSKQARERQQTERYNEEMGKWREYTESNIESLLSDDDIVRDEAISHYSGMTDEEWGKIEHADPYLRTRLRRALDIAQKRREKGQEQAQAEQEEARAEQREEAGEEKEAQRAKEAAARKATLKRVDTFIDDRQSEFDALLAREPDADELTSGKQLTGKARELYERKAEWSKVGRAIQAGDPVGAVAILIRAKESLAEIERLMGMLPETDERESDAIRRMLQEYKAQQ
ncbi:MAG: hypothetical protein KGY99_10650 [Phycisphaerae bacterium]|nr:hypothetical protein [Phycisphaerae bacterium]